MTKGIISRIATLGTVSAATAATVVFASGPAVAAGVDSFTYTKTTKYGQGLYFSGPERFDVCDTDADGHQVQGRIWSKSNKSDMKKELDGGGSGCDPVSFKRAKGTKIYIQMCRWNERTKKPVGCGKVSSRGRAS